MDWISVANFKSDFAIAKRATDAQAQLALDAAEDELTELVGQDVIDDTLSATPSNTTRAARVVRAHKFLAASIQCLNVGNVKKAQDTGSPANPVLTNEWWNPKEIGEMRENWRQMALKAIGPYLMTDASGDDLGFEPEFAEGVALTDSCTDYCN